MKDPLDELQRVKLEVQALRRERDGLLGEVTELSDRLAACQRELEETRSRAAHAADRTQLLEQILSVIPHHVFWKAKDLVYLGCNENFARVAGLERPGQIVGRSDYDLPWKDEEARGYRKFDREVMATGQSSYNVEETQTQADGSTALLQTSMVPLRDDNGDVIGILGIYLDITQQRRIEQEREEARRRWRSLAKNAADTILLTDVAGRIEFVNHGQAGVEWALNASVLDWVSPEQLPTVKALVRRVIEEQRAQHAELQLTLSRRGPPKWFLCRVGPVLQDDEVVGLTVFLTDVTARREIEERSRAQRELLERILTLIPNQVCWKSRELVYMGCNALFARAVGLQFPEDVIGLTDADLPLSAELAERQRDRDLDVLDEHSILNEEEIRHDFRGRERVLLASRVPLLDEEGDVMGVLSVFNDITQQSRIQRQLQEARDALALRVEDLHREVQERIRAEQMAVEANSAKSVFLANMSHELRTPLNAIIGYSSLVEEEASESGWEALGPDLQRIRGAAEHLLGVVSDILDLSKIEAGKMDVYVESFKAKPLVLGIVDSVRTLIAQGGNTLEVTCDPSVDRIEADRVKLRQVLYNLLSNAAKFTKDGRITVRVEPHVRASRAYVSFQVVDTGIGIPPNKIASLFDAFTQAEDNTTQRFGGTGLGLAISKRFCEMMGGDLWAESTLGQGSRFTFVLPVVRTQEQPAQ